MAFSLKCCLSAYAISDFVRLYHFDASASFYPVSDNRFVTLKHRRFNHCSSLTVESKKGIKDNNAGNDDSRAWFPEAVLLKKRERKEDGRVLPDFADKEEENLYEKLMLELDNTVDVKAMRHYEAIYMIHEDRENELEAVRQMIHEFINEKKGKIWREADWGIRRLAYKIKRTTKAHYLAINVELESKWVNEFKYLLEKDERVVRYLVARRFSASPKHCLPPPDPKDETTPRGYKAMIPEDWGDDDDDDDDENDDDENDDDENDDEDEDNDFEK